MESTLSISFEQLLKLSMDLPIPTTDAERDVKWCDDKQVLGLSRQPGGGIELFLTGPRLHTLSPLVRRHLKFDEWSRSGGTVFNANRLVFPAEDYYVPATAFLAEELLRNGVSQSLTRGFAVTEPLIEMVLRRLGLSEDEMLGLLGELRFLDVLLTSTNDMRKRAIALDSWRGHERGTRDFYRGSCSIEVKTTTLERSRHHINNVTQIDPRLYDSELGDEQLYLISMGFRPCLQPSDEMNSISIPSQVESILMKLGHSNSSREYGELQTLFLEKVSAYGAVAGRGYDHEEMKGWAAYAARWQHQFLRIYDMSDSEINVLRREDVRRKSHVVFDSVNFEIDLPERITGDLNPQTDPFILARFFLE